MQFRNLAVAALLFGLFHGALADDAKDALFGLKWGMTTSEIKGFGISLSKVKGDRNLDFYSTTSLPKQLSDAESYTLVFSEGKLVKLIAIGKDIANDPNGTDGKERFDVLKKSLQDKYGTPSTNYQSVGNKLFKEHDEFYQCLAYSGCGLWVALFTTPTKVVAVELNGLRRGTGYIQVSAEAVPGWHEALEKVKSFKNRSDADAL